MMIAVSMDSGRAPRSGLHGAARVDQRDHHLGEALERGQAPLGPGLTEAGKLADEAGVEGGPLG